MINRFVLLFSLCLLALQPELEAQSEKPVEIRLPNSFSRHVAVWDQSLKRLEKSDPIDDLRKALRKSDFRFIGFARRLINVPGLTPKQVDYVLHHGPGVNILKGSSDKVNEDLARRTNRIAQTYMKPYNIALLSYLRNRKRNV